MLPVFILDGSKKKNQNYQTPQSHWNIMQAGILQFHKNLRPLSEIKEPFLEIIGPLSAFTEGESYCFCSYYFYVI